MTLSEWGMIKHTHTGTNTHLGLEGRPHLQLQIKFGIAHASMLICQIISWTWGFPFLLPTFTFFHLNKVTQILPPTVSYFHLDKISLFSAHYDQFKRHSVYFLTGSEDDICDNILYNIDYILIKDIPCDLYYLFKEFWLSYEDFNPLTREAAHF